MVSAIEGEGLTVQEYNAIGEQTRNDPEAEATVRRLIQQQLDG